MTLVGIIRDALLGTWLKRQEDKIEDTPLGHCTALADVVMKVIAPSGVMLSEEQFDELLTMVDTDAKLYNSRGASVAAALKKVLARYEEMQIQNTVSQWLQERPRTIEATLPNGKKITLPTGPAPGYVPRT